jgi:hypothetical protein
LNDEEKTIVFDAILYLHNRHYDLSGVVVMPDHFHLIIKPLMNKEEGYISLPKIFHSIKSFTAMKISKVNGIVWQDEHYDHIIS